MIWKIGRQGAPALSTTWSELKEAIESLSLGGTVQVMVQVIWDAPCANLLKVDT